MKEMVTNEKDCMEAGLHIVSVSELWKQEEEEKSLQDFPVIQFNKPYPYCTNGDLDRCPHKCGACLYGKVPEYAAYLGKYEGKDYYCEV